MSKSRGQMSTLEYLQFAETQKICRIDAPAVSSDIDKYCASNAEQYYVVINTWLNLVYDITGSNRSISILRDALKTRGLIHVLNACGEIVDAYLRDASDSGVWYPFTQDAEALITIVDKDIDDDLYLQIFRFPKRFSPVSADLILEKTIETFNDVNRRIRRAGGCQYNPLIIDCMKHHLAIMCKHFRTNLTKEIGSLTTGVCSDAKTLKAKLRRLSEIIPFFEDVLYSIGSNRVDKRRPLTVKIIAVPKSYKAHRLIAPEPTVTTYELTKVRHALTRSLSMSVYSTMCDPEDQEISRDLIERGSITGDLASIDLSSASDGISAELMSIVLPTDIYNLIESYRPRYYTYEIRGKRFDRILNTWLTSGNPCTFILESMFFLAVCLTAYDICCMLDGITPNYAELIIRVFGDDLIVPAWLYDAVVEVLHNLNCVVNEDKSYKTGGFREACGRDFFYGYKVTTQYWPRKPLQKLDAPDSVASLCSLQHNLWRWPQTAAFLTDVVKSVVPDMTSSYPGTDCFDLWSHFPVFGARMAPVDKSNPKWRDICNNIPKDVLLREAHYVAAPVIEKYPQTIVADTYRYVHFLKHGPKIPDDPVLALAGCTQADAEMQLSDRRPVIELRKKTI